jgi:hypothetical protein
MQPNEPPKPALYWLLFAIQIAGAIGFVWQELPEFGQVLNNPGEQLPKNIRSDLTIAGIFLAMQIAFWLRVLRVPIPFRRPNLFSAASALFSAAHYSPSSCSGIFRRWTGHLTSF